MKGLLANGGVKVIALDLEVMERIKSVSLGEFVTCHVACVLEMCHLDRIIEVNRPQG